MDKADRIELLRLMWPELKKRSLEELEERGTCMQEAQHRLDLERSIPAMIATFPEYFGLEGKRRAFRISHEGYYVGATGLPIVGLEVLEKAAGEERETWVSYVVFTIEELRRRMTSLEPEATMEWYGHDAVGKAACDAR